MEITASEQSSATLVKITGSMDALTCDETQAFFDTQINSTQVRLVVDLSRVDYLSSAGLRVLLSALKSARQRGGDLYLVGVQDSVHQVLALAGFVSIFKIFPMATEAFEAFPS